MGKRKIFLSYLRVDTARVLKLYDRLSGAGFEPWIDVKDIPPGQSWKEATENAIRTSDFFLACLTKGAFDSEGFFKKELEWAVHNWKKKRRCGFYLVPVRYLIPVRLEACEVPKILQTFHWLDLYKRGRWDRLLEALSDPLTPREVLPSLGIAAGFVAGMLGSLLADLLRQGWFGNPFTPTQVIVSILMTLAGLCVSVWVARLPLQLPRFTQFWPGHQRLTLVLAFMLFAVPVAVLLSVGLREWLIRTRDCDEVGVSALEFRLTAEQLSYPGSDITLPYQALYNRQNLAGRAVLSNLRDGEECACEWGGGINKLTQQQLPPRSEAKDCIFSIPFQDDVKEINLTLKVGRRAGTSGFETVKSFDFKINVQR